ncbi:SLAM family member 5-like [Pagrus major]|uniref:SLAM family member 5-like n=1 Tax=Pagrus major TaxID=143350 RepID=UPI003CC8707C
MTPVVLLFAVSLLQSCETQGTSSGTPEFVQTGKDLILHVKERFALKKGDDFRWKFNGNTNIVKLGANIEPFIYDDYEGRVEFSIQNYTLCLKNVQKADSGRYTAVVSGNKDEVKAEYKVTALDPVSPVKLTVKSSSSDSCNLTVTCSTIDSHISSTFTCHNKTCSEEGGERSEGTPYPSSMNVYLKQGVIICNHSNQVSLERVELEIKHHCEQPPESNISNEAGIGIGAAGLVIVLGIICSVFLCRYYKKKSNGNTIYEVPQDVPKTESLYQDPTDEVSGLSPTSTYCLVQFQTRPEQPPRNTPQPETVYAQVNRAAKTKCRSPQNKHPELNNMDDNDVQD